MCVDMCVYVYACVWAYVCMYRHVCVWSCVCMDGHVCTQVDMWKSEATSGMSPHCTCLR